GIQEPGIGIGSEVHHNSCSRRDSACHLDVEHDLGVGTVGVAGRLVLSAVHRHRYNGWNWRDLEATEIGVEVGLGETTSEFDDADGLAFAGQPSREVV